jgi:hypothetical protein
MSIKKTCEKVKKGIDEGVYKMVRLLQRQKQGSKFVDNVIITCNKMGKEHALSRLKHIELELVNDLPPGRYIIQAYTGSTQSSMKKNFEVDKTAPIRILESKAGSENKSETVHDYTHHQEEPMTTEEYRKLIQENADLRADNRMLLFEIDSLKREINRLDSGSLNDSGNAFAPVIETLKEYAPGIIGLAEKYLDNKDREISLKERSINKVPLKKTSMPKKDPREEMVDYIDELLDSNPEKANEELDKLEESNLELYNYVVDELGLSEEETEEE